MTILTCAIQNLCRWASSSRECCRGLQYTSFQTPLHLLCANAAVSVETLTLLVKAHNPAANVADKEGQMPLHYLTKTKPEEGDLWQALMKETPAIDASDAAGAALSVAGAFCNMAL